MLSFDRSSTWFLPRQFYLNESSNWQKKIIVAIFQVVIDDDRVITVTAQIAISVGEPISISYTDPLQTTAARRRFLLNGKYFLCRCSRCQDPTEYGTYLSGLRCLQCPTGTVLPISRGETMQWSCNTCQEEMSAENAEQTEEWIEDVITSTLKLPIGPNLIDRCQSLTLSLSKKLDSSHALLMRLKIHL